jgi:putative transposase
MWYYKSKKDDSEVMDKLMEMSETKPNRGFDYYYHRIRKQGFIWNRKRVLRIYRLLGLTLRRKSRKRLPARTKTPLGQPAQPREVWSMDFMSDSLATGRRFRVLNIIDDYNRQALCTTPEFSMPSVRVVAHLKQAIEVYGKPLEIRVDNGPEFLSRIFVQFCESETINIKYIQPGKPSQNGYVERFNKTFREDVLDAYLFRNIEEAKTQSEVFREDYNQNHPHKSLGRKSPNELLNDFLKGASPFEKHFVNLSTV